MTRMVEGTMRGWETAGDPNLCTSANPLIALLRLILEYSTMPTQRTFMQIVNVKAYIVYEATCRTGPPVMSDLCRVIVVVLH